MTKLKTQENRILVAGLQEAIKILVANCQPLIDGVITCYKSDLNLQTIAEMALIKAATKFPLDSEHKFASYAVWWISIAIRQELGLPLETTEGLSPSPPGGG